LAFILALGGGSSVLHITRSLKLVLQLKFQPNESSINWTSLLCKVEFTLLQSIFSRQIFLLYFGKGKFGGKKFTLQKSEFYFAKEFFRINFPYPNNKRKIKFPNKLSRIPFFLRKLNYKLYFHAAYFAKFNS
jgi:hypothetical protein